MGHTLRKLLAAIMVACFSITFLAGCGDTPEEKAQKQAEREARQQQKAQEEAEKQAKIEAEKAAKEAAEEAEKKAEEEAAAKEAAKTPEERAAEDGVQDIYRWFYGTDRYNAYVAMDDKHSSRDLATSVQNLSYFRVSITEVDKRTKIRTFSEIRFSPRSHIKEDADLHLPKYWQYGRTTCGEDPYEARDPWALKRVKSIALLDDDPKSARWFEGDKMMLGKDADEMRALFLFMLSQY